MGVAMTTIRPMSGDDLADVVALETANQPRPWTEGVFRDELAAENRIYLVAVDEVPEPRVRDVAERRFRPRVHNGDELAGFGGIMVIGDEAHVTNLLVDPRSRRRGIGKDLMLALFESAIGAGARHLTLEVRKENEVARALYAGLGLVPVGVRPRYYGDDDALILWAHDIDRPGFVEGLR